GNEDGCTTVALTPCRPRRLAPRGDVAAEYYPMRTRTLAAGRHDAPTVGRFRTKGAAEPHITVDENDTDTRRVYERHGVTNSQRGTVERMLCYPQEFCGPSSGQHATGTLR